MIRLTSFSLKEFFIGFSSECLDFQNLRLSLQQNNVFVVYWGFRKGLKFLNPAEGFFFIYLCMQAVEEPLYPLFWDFEVEAVPYEVGIEIGFKMSKAKTICQ